LGVFVKNNSVLSLVFSQLKASHFITYHYYKDG
jgi:hypothetical protein